MDQLIQKKPLDPKFLDHPLKGEYSDCRECHIEPDWLLIYLEIKNTIIFVRTGSHADLFK
jgi:mRNA interferase YafQ